VFLCGTGTRPRAKQRAMRSPCWGPRRCRGGMVVDTVGALVRGIWCGERPGEIQWGKYPNESQNKRGERMMTAIEPMVSIPDRKWKQTQQCSEVGPGKKSRRCFENETIKIAAFPNSIPCPTPPLLPPSSIILWLPRQPGEGSALRWEGHEGPRGNDGRRAAAPW